MCFGGGDQPEAPTNPAPYSLDQSETAVKAEATSLSMQAEDDPAKDVSKPSPAKNSMAPARLRGGTGVNSDPLSM